MVDMKTAVPDRLSELNTRSWDLPVIEARFLAFIENGFPAKPLDPRRITADKQAILDRVQRKAEEYCYLTRNCAKGSATALFEEFGLGNMEIIKALNPFPGLGMSGGICGPVAGGLVALSLFFSGEDAIGTPPSVYVRARQYLERFKATFGGISCPDVQTFIFGRYLDPMASPEHYEEFNKEGAREKCPLAPGFGARLTAEIIIESLEGEKAP